MYGVPLHCDAQNCHQTSLFRFGSCVICWRHFCGDHLRDPTAHDCDKASKAVRAERQATNRSKAYGDIISKLDVPKLLSAAESLRPGHKAIAPPLPLLPPCMVNQPGTPLLGQGSNLHIPISFSDGIKWMIRIRQKGWDGPNWEVLKLGMESEVVTLNYMRDRGVAVPRAHIRVERDGLCEDLIYSFLECINGKSLEQRHDKAILGITTTDRDLTTIRSLAKHFLDLERITFNSFGSLHPSFTVPPQIFDNSTSDPSVVIGPFIRYFPTSPIPPFFSGPFRTAKEMDLLRGCGDLEDGLGYIKYGDDKGDHFMVDETGRLTGVFDWEWYAQKQLMVLMRRTYITSKHEAFAAPFALTDRDFRKEGSNVLSPREELLAKVYEDDFGRPDMAKFVREGKKYQRLYELLRFEDRKWRSAMAMRRAFEGGLDEAEEDAPKTMAEWVEVTRRRHAGDEGLEIIERRVKLRAASMAPVTVIKQKSEEVIAGSPGMSAVSG